MMEPFEFLLGEWTLEYQIPHSVHHDACTGSGSGVIQQILDGQYVTFNYECHIQGETEKAHAIFAWDKSMKLYRYWWFENSGHFQTATCKFINKDTLFLNWHDTLLIQTFQKTGPDQVILKMKEPDSESIYQLILQVVLIRK